MRLSKDNGIIKGITVTRNISISHLMFIDDILLGGESTVGEWRTMRYLIKSFGVVSGLYMNEGKSILLHNDSEENVTKDICDMFQVA